MFSVFNRSNIPVFLYFAMNGSSAGEVIGMYDAHHQIERNVARYALKNSFRSTLNSVYVRCLYGNNFQFTNLIYSVQPVLLALSSDKFDIDTTNRIYQSYALDLPLNMSFEHNNILEFRTQSGVIIYAVLAYNIGFAFGYYTGKYMSYPFVCSIKKWALLSWLKIKGIFNR